eukprot:scaffold79038_cov39-Phaeocystis_antarctica.AAC.2
MYATEGPNPRPADPRQNPSLAGRNHLELLTRCEPRLGPLTLTLTLTRPHPRGDPRPTRPVQFPRAAGTVR